MKLQSIYAYDPADSAEIRGEKNSIFLVAGACCLAGVAWASMYALVFGWGIITLLPLAFVVLVGGSLLISHHTKNHLIAVYTQIICIMYITTFIQWSIGDVFASGVVLIWAFVGPIVALMFFSVRQSMVWFALYLVNLVVTVLFNDTFAARGQLVSEELRLILFALNLGIASLVVFVFALYFVATARRERAKADALLLNVLPKEIAPLLKDNGRTIADHYDQASVLFADIVGSTALFTNLEAAVAVDWLNDVFSAFDQLVDRYGVEKIRTIGDNYMVAAGVPVPRSDHAHALVHLALDMLAVLHDMPQRHGIRIDFRLGINSGPLVAGVIGKRKFHYDVWGDTVNIASRMESHGVPGRVQITEATWKLVNDAFRCTPRGEIDVKGRGMMKSYFVTGRKERSGRDATTVRPHNS